MNRGNSTPGRNIIVIGASAGGVEALLHVIDNLPERIDAAIFIVMHLPSTGKSHLPEIISRHTKIPTGSAVDGEALEQNRIYIAPTNRHLVIKKDSIQLSIAPKINGFRPSIDVTLESAASVHGCQTIGVILSGALDDGTAGMQAVKAAGGVCIVQEPEEALYPSMPLSAMEQVKVDYVLPAKMISSQLVPLVHEPLPEPCPGYSPNGDVMDELAQDITAFEEGSSPNSPGVLTCPECGGVMWVTDKAGFERYTCHTGHQYSTESLLSVQAQSLEYALRAAVRALHERAMFCGRLASRARDHGHSRMEQRFVRFKREGEENERTILALLERPYSVDSQVDAAEGDEVGLS